MAQFLFLARGTPNTPHDEVEQLGGAEAAVVWHGFKAGAVRAMYYLEAQAGAALILDLPDRAEAESFLHSLPMVAAGIVAAELIPIQPYDGLERLFVPEAGR